MKPRAWISAVLAWAALASASAQAAAQRDLIVVVGAEGEPSYKPVFRKEAEAWSAAATAAGLSLHTINGSASSLSYLKATLASLPKDGGDLWLVLIGHGTFDGRNAKFNLPGDDLSASDLKDCLKPFHRRLILLNLFSASGAFLPYLSGNNRVVLTATRSGAERNYSRFGEKMADDLTSAEADLDADGRISLAELSARATAEVVKFYEDQQRIVPEHALLDDNGDRLGTETSLLIGRQPSSESPNPDGLVAMDVSLRESAQILAFTPDQRERRAAIEKQIAALRTRKPALNEDNYYLQLEGLMLQMAALYSEVRSTKEPAGAGGPHR